jgi:hypothetical protein
VTHRSCRFFDVFDRSLLCCASLLLPQKRRAEWRLEWESELWHVRRTRLAPGAVSWRAEREIVFFCLGAFQDAICLRWLWWQNQPRYAPFQGSPVACLAWLAGILLAVFLSSLLLPGVRAVHSLSNNRVRPGTILIQDDAADNRSIPSMTIEQVRIWQRTRQRYFDEFAFYRITKEPVQLGSQASGTWAVAQASANLFSLVGWPVHHVAQNDALPDDSPRLVLSERAWRRHFGADPEIVGKLLHVGTRLGRVVGVAPDDLWRMPGQADVWLLEPDSEITPAGTGYVVAHLTRRGRLEMWAGLVRIASFNSRDSEHDFLGISLEEQTPGPWPIFLFASLLAALTLPVVTAVSSAEFIFNTHKPAWIRRAVRIAFLGAKIVMLLAIAYFSSVDLAYYHLPAFSTAAVYIQLISSYFISLFGVRWALMDQHRRCPVCLRPVAHPAEVGILSRTFLDWSGTELMCAGGHTLLHVPALPTSWFSTQRWMFLDSSWDFLFAG